MRRILKICLDAFSQRGVALEDNSSHRINPIYTNWFPLPIYLPG